MGNCEEVKPYNSEKSSSPEMDQNNAHAYPDWATMQAFYGPRLAMPPYLNTAVASPHAPPPYMWAPPQSMIPPYGAPYAAFYAHGGVYGHPGIPLAGTTLSMETLVKPTGNTDGSFVKKLKEFDGLAISIGNDNSDGVEHETEHRQSDSNEDDGSSDASNRVMARTGERANKRSRQASPKKVGEGKVHTKNSSVPTIEAERVPEKMIDVIPPANTPVKTMENTSSKLVLKDPSQNLKSSPSNALEPTMPNGAWLQNDRELKRERRKQSNRESARRSRLRKQAEAEELATKVKVLTAENMTLTSEMNKLIESSEKLKLENVALMEKLKDAQVGQIEEVNLHKIDDLRLKPVGTVNLLARVNNNSNYCNNRKNEDEDSHENRKTGAKLHQLLDTSPRKNAVAAG